MRRTVASWMLWAAAMSAALGGAWVLRGSALYRGYVAGRATGAILFSIVQAVGPGGSLEAARGHHRSAHVQTHERRPL